MPLPNPLDWPSHLAHPPPPRVFLSLPLCFFCVNRNCRLLLSPSPHRSPPTPPTLHTRIIRSGDGVNYSRNPISPRLLQPGHTSGGPSTPALGLPNPSRPSLRPTPRVSGLAAGHYAGRENMCRNWMHVVACCGTIHLLLSLV
ncbi:unnamed protein product [Protopolystoma xenopodis]|uniref:Uncharacterized protein n=1 Tax=Protopolystoma xenopodis TaxID=117903 RepID=A0A448XBH1_9PLAT|nr:unnamed protein product [Protopolystoma xenopodis]